MKSLLAPLVSWLILVPTIAIAQNNTPQSPFAEQEINDLLKAFIGLVRYALDWTPKIGGAIVVAMIIYSGIQYVTGNAERGKKTLFAAVIGTIIVAMAYAIISSLNMILIAPES